MIFVGIDPGKTGGVFFLNGITNTGYGLPMPLDATGDACVSTLQEYFLEACLKWDMPNYKVHVLIEEQQRGKKISFQEGRLTACVDLIGANRLSARPQVWQKRIFSNLEEVPDDTKQASMAFCEQMGMELPTLTPTGTVLHDGIADAYCMAVYCMLKVLDI